MLLAAIAHRTFPHRNGSFGMRDYFRLFIFKQRSQEYIGKEWLSKCEKSNRCRLRERANATANWTCDMNVMSAFFA
jgi:hypothetical protein